MKKIISTLAILALSTVVLGEIRNVPYGDTDDYGMPVHYYIDPVNQPTNAPVVPNESYADRTLYDYQYNPSSDLPITFNLGFENLVQLGKVYALYVELSDQFLYTYIKRLAEEGTRTYLSGCREENGTGIWLAVYSVIPDTGENKPSTKVTFGDVEDVEHMSSPGVTLPTYYALLDTVRIPMHYLHNPTEDLEIGLVRADDCNSKTLIVPEKRNWRRYLWSAVDADTNNQNGFYRDNFMITVANILAP
ncbi:MAG: hypothetical protein QME07_04165 [bacterium]|nr:hypothetical protein [bacterium]